MAKTANTKYIRSILKACGIDRISSHYTYKEGVPTVEEEFCCTICSGLPFRFIIEYEEDDAVSMANALSEYRAWLGKTISSQVISDENVDEFRRRLDAASAAIDLALEGKPYVIPNFRKGQEEA